MAIKQLEMIAPVDTVKKKGRKGGGGIGGAIGGVAGGIVGGLAGAAATTLTGGAAAPTVAMGAAGGAAVGHNLGSMIGEKIKASREGSTSAMQRRMMPTQQLVQSDRTAKLRESILALHSQPPEVQQQYAPTLVQGYLKSLADDGVA